MIYNNSLQSNISSRYQGRIEANRNYHEYIVTNPLHICISCMSGYDVLVVHVVGLSHKHHVISSIGATGIHTHCPVEWPELNYHIDGSLYKATPWQLRH